MPLVPSKIWIGYFRKSLKRATPDRDIVPGGMRETQAGVYRACGAIENYFSQGLKIGTIGLGAVPL